MDRRALETETTLMIPSSPATALWPLALYTASVVLLAALMIFLSYILGERHREGATGQQYESGIISTGSVRMRFDVRFYLVAMFFVIFDLETVFIVAWAISFRRLGWPGYTAVVLFIAILAAVLVYLWRTGALQWGASLRRAATPEGKG